MFHLLKYLNFGRKTRVPQYLASSNKKLEKNSPVASGVQKNYQESASAPPIAQLRGWCKPGELGEQIYLLDVKVDTLA